MIVFKEKIKYVIPIIFIIIIFILASYISQNNLDFLTKYIKGNVLGIIIYIAILIVSAVIAPIDLVFLMPVASAAWGVVPAALLSLIGWTLGSSIVFFLCRRYGVQLIKKLLPLEKINKYERIMPKKNVFLSIIFLRIAMPIDIISYAIGLLTKIRFAPFFFSTLIGFTPLAFFLAYVGTLPMEMQIIGIILFLLIVTIGFLSVKHRHR